MEKLFYFTQKSINILFEIHPLIYLIIFIFVAIFYLITQRLLKTYFKNLKNLKIKSAFIAILIGMPLFIVIIYLTISIMRINQPF